jgi:hypothetical protein
MKANLKKAGIKRALAILPLLAGATLPAAAGPIMLGGSDMDRITAGTQKIFEQAAGLLVAMSGQALDGRTEDVPALAVDQSALLQKMHPASLSRSSACPPVNWSLLGNCSPGSKSCWCGRPRLPTSHQPVH